MDFSSSWGCIVLLFSILCPPPPPSSPNVVPWTLPNAFRNSPTLRCVVFPCLSLKFHIHILYRAFGKNIFIQKYISTSTFSRGFIVKYNKSSPIRSIIRDLQYWLQGVRTAQKHVKTKLFLQVPWRRIREFKLAPFILNLGIRFRWVVIFMPRPL